MNDGLQHKYDVVKRSTGETVTDCFVITPSKDLHSRRALLAYAQSCWKEYPELSEDLLRWIRETS